MRKTLFSALAALVIAPLAFPQNAFACSCMYYENEEERMAAFYNNADLVFQGIPFELEQGTEHQYSIEVERVWKGKADAYTDVITADNSAACGIELALNERVLIFAYESDGKYHTGLCSGTMPAKEAASIIEWLNGDKEPVSPPKPVEYDCRPYVCANGESFPSCTEDGHVINYLIAPCQQFTEGEEEHGNEEPELFADVSQEHPNATAITFVKNEGIVQGYEDGTYGPEKFINRAEFTKIIVGANYPAESIDECESDELFTDVSQKDWFADYVCMAKQNGIIDGYPDGSFKPSNSINFAEASKIVVGAFGIKTSPQDIGDIWWRPYVFALARIGGLPSSFSDPNQQLTRGDMAEIIFRVMMGMDS